MVFVGNLEGRRTLGRTFSIWKVNTKWSLKKK
jgi:hypothetical protein